MNEKKYEEVGSAYRFFLGWRHASFAGNLVVLYGVCSLLITAHRNAPNLMWTIPLAASPVGLLFWWIDVRTRDLYHAAMRAGKALEGDAGGFYSELQNVALPRDASAFQRVTQSGALNVFFLGSSLILLVSGVALLWKQLCAGS
jgi:hypothetical protein